MYPHRKFIAIVMCIVFVCIIGWALCQMPIHPMLIRAIWIWNLFHFIFAIDIMYNTMETRKQKVIFVCLLGPLCLYSIFVLGAWAMGEWLFFDNALINKAAAIMFGAWNARSSVIYTRKGAFGPPK